MLWQEVKHMLFSKYIILSIIIIFVLSFGLDVLLIDKDDDVFIDEGGAYSGEMTEAKLWQGLKKARDEDSDEEGPSFVTGFISGLIYNYPRLMYLENKVKDYPDSYAKEFYKCWHDKAAAIINTIPEGDREMALDGLEKVIEPFSMYPGYYYWDSTFNNLKIVFLIIIFLVSFLGASSYSESVENGSVEVIKCSVNGRRAMALRIVPVILYGIILTVVAVSAGVIYTGSITGFNVLKSSLKGFALFSIGNLTYLDGLILMCLSEIFGICATVAVMGFISIRTGKTGMATAIGVGINLFYIIFSFFIYIPFKFMEIIINAMPAASSQVIGYVSGFQFDLSIWRPYEVILSMIVVFIIFMIFLLREISKI